jgi:phosphonoacetate hydrolase
MKLAPFTLDEPIACSFRVTTRIIDVLLPAWWRSVLTVRRRVLNAAMCARLMPNVAADVPEESVRARAPRSMPTFTNVNNASIVTGSLLPFTVFAANFFLHEAAGREVMMNSAAFLTRDTIFPAAAKTGAQSCVVTAKEKV